MQRSARYFCLPLQSLLTVGQQKLLNQAQKFWPERDVAQFQTIQGINSPAMSLRTPV